MHTQFENNQASACQSKVPLDAVHSVSRPSSIFVKAKLDMTQPSDSEEQEADAMADSIVNEGKIARAVSTGHSGEGVALSSSFGGQLSAFQGQGSRLYGGLKEKMESGFGRDFSNVRLHTDAAAAEMSSSISAKAFTYGNDIYFNRGQFNPESQAGQHLIAHELTHVAQGTGKLAREINYSAPFYDFGAQTSSLDAYSYLSSLSVKTQQQIQDPAKPRYTKIGDATEENLKSYHPEGITVAFILSNKDDEEKAFLEIDDKYKIKDRLYAFHPSSAYDIINILEACKMYGPLQNVIITGHGNWSIITMSGSFRLSIDPNNPNYNGTIMVFDKINRCLEYGRSLNPNLKQSIYLHACLTNSHVHNKYSSRMNFSEVLKRHIEGNVKIWANSASSAVQDVDYSSDGSGSLEVTDTYDHPSVLQDIYEGGELIDGRPRKAVDDWIGVNRDVSKLYTQVEKILYELMTKGDIFSDKKTEMRAIQYVSFVLKAISLVNDYDDSIHSQMSESVSVIADLLYRLELVQIKERKYEPVNIIYDIIDKVEDVELKNRLMRLYNSDHSLRMSFNW